MNERNTNDKILMNSATILPDRSIGAILIDSGKLSINDVEQILRLQKTDNLRFGDAAIKLELLTPTDIQHALSHQYDYPYLLRSDEGVSDKLVAAYNPFCPEVEALRTLRSQLMLRLRRRGPATA